MLVIARVHRVFFLRPFPGLSLGFRGLAFGYHRVEGCVCVTGLLYLVFFPLRSRDAVTGGVVGAGAGGRNAAAAGSLNRRRPRSAAPAAGKRP